MSKVVIYCAASMLCGLGLGIVVSHPRTPLQSKHFSREKILTGAAEIPNFPERKFMREIYTDAFTSSLGTKYKNHKLIASLDTFTGFAFVSARCADAVEDGPNE